MRRSAPVILLGVAISSTWLTAAQQSPTRNLVPSEYIATLHRVLETYAAGDDLAVEGLLRTREGIQSMAALEAVFGRPAEWTRPRAAFLAEVAVAAPLSNRGKLTAIRIGQALAVSRPPLTGANSTDDRVEMLWHQIVLGVYQELKFYPQQLDYLDAIAPRLDDATRRGAAPATRLVLARAVAASGFCCPPRGDPVRVLVEGDRDERRNARATFEDAMALFERAAADADLAAEARIRGAALQFTMSHPADALAWLDRVPSFDDKLLRYAQSLTRARALDLLDQPEAAAAAYEAARRDFPAAQTPAIGRAAALLRSGQTAEAVRVAGAARRLPPEGPDPWADFTKADARFVKQWLAELRTIRQ